MQIVALYLFAPVLSAVLPDVLFFHRQSLREKMTNLPVTEVSLSGSAEAHAAVNSQGNLSFFQDPSAFGVVESPLKVNVPPLSSQSGFMGLSGIFSFVDSGFRSGFSMPHIQKGLEIALDPTVSSGEVLAWGIKSSEATRSAANLFSVVKEAVGSFKEFLRG